MSEGRIKDVQSKSPLVEKDIVKVSSRDLWAASQASRKKLNEK